MATLEMVRKMADHGLKEYIARQTTIGQRSDRSFDTADDKSIIHSRTPTKIRKPIVWLGSRFERLSSGA